MEKNHIKKPLTHSSSLSSLSSSSPNSPPVTKTKKNTNPHSTPSKTTTKQTISDDDAEELPDVFGALSSKTTRQSSNKKTTSESISPSTSSNPLCRRSSRILSSTSKPSPITPSTTINTIKLKKLITPTVSEKFSLAQILKEQRARAEKQATLKRTRQELGISDSEHQIPDQFPQDEQDTLLTPNKKRKNFQSHSNTTTNRLNSISTQDPASPSKISDPPDSNPSMSSLLNENDINCLDTPVAHQSIAQKPKRLQKLLQDDVASGQQNGLNRGLNYRQLFHPNLLEPVSTPVSPTPLPSLDCYSLKCVAQDPAVVEFVQELIETLEDSIKYPDALSLDLTSMIPQALTIGALNDESCTMMTHQTIFRLLFQPIIDPQYLLRVAERSLRLIQSLLATFSSIPYLNRLREFWLNTLQDALCRLGLLHQHIFFGNYPSENSDSEQDGQNISFEFDLGASIQRIRLILKLFVVLSSASYLNDCGRLWALTIALRLGLEPLSSGLHADVVGVIGHVLEMVCHGGGSDQTTKETKIHLMVETLKVGIDMHTWTNQLELVRLIPAHFPFRKSLVIGLLDLAVCHHSPADPNPLAQDDGLVKLSRWLSHISNRFTTAPPAKEIFSTIKEVSRRPYEQKQAATATARTGEGVGGEEVDRETETEEQRMKRRMASGVEMGKTLKAGKFRKAFAGYLGPEKAMNEAQFTALVMLFQISLHALWDFLVDPSNADLPIPPRPLSQHSPAFVHPSSSSSSSSAAPKHSSNVWITLIQQSLEALDHSIKSCTSPQHQAERIKLKNALYRLAIGLEILNRESFLVIKGIDSKGQFKLDRFWKKP